MCVCEVNLQRGGIKDEEIVAKCKQNAYTIRIAGEEHVCARGHIYHILTETMTHTINALSIVNVCVCSVRCIVIGTYLVRIMFHIANA